MRITPEQRDHWLEQTARGPFNQWLDAQIRDGAGQLDLELLHAVALRYGVDRRAQYARLNPGQQRMNIGNLLRKRVPPCEYGGQLEASPATASPALIPQPGVDDADVPPAVASASVRELLELHGQICTELQRRGVTRTANSPGGDYAELLFARAFGWSLAGNSAQGFDALDAAGVRYQIKSRRLARPNSSRQLSALRNLPAKPFDKLAGVLFGPDYKVLRAVIIPHERVEPRCRYSDHVKAWIYFLDDSVWLDSAAVDVTDRLKAAAEAL